MSAPERGGEARRRRRSWRGRALLVLLVVALAVGMLLAGGILGGIAELRGPGQSQPQAGPDVPGRFDAATPGVGAAGTAAGIDALQERLRRLPGDWTAWSSLGAAYVHQASLTADPSYYAKAEGAFVRSLQERPQDNAPALTGQGALAAARHDFAGALRLAEQAGKVNPYDSAALGVQVDALIELGRYDEAFAALQRMVDLKPGVPSYTRVSYAYELRGNVEGARVALERALQAAGTPDEAAYALRYLGELAFSQGDLEQAERRFREGLRRDPGYVPLIAGNARVLAARGKTEEALAAFAQVVARLPEPGYLVEYADLLAANGHAQEAQRQYDVLDATVALYRAQGVDVDLELALYQADHGRPAEALTSAAAAYAKRRSVAVEDAYAWALHSAGRSREALQHARAAARLGTRSAPFAYHRGMIEKELGMRKDAIASLRRALELNPHFSPLQAPRARQALIELGGDS